METDVLLEVRGITKSFGSTPILKGISLSVRNGEFLTLLGPSGCGKTTTLRVIAGFESPDTGSVILKGQDVTALPPYRRDVHTVFQHYALFPHYNVSENVAFGLKIKGVSAPEISRRVTEALALVKLSGFETRRTGQLSGGQMQRIALARALVGRPALLLLDEPLGALDLKLRKEMQLELKHLQRKLGLAFVYVTHDQEEAMHLSDRVALFRAGTIEQIGTPAEIYERPRTSFVADFLGSANLLNAEILDVTAGSLLLRLENELEVERPCSLLSNYKAGQRLMVAIRPERIGVSYNGEGASEPGRLRLKASLIDNVFVGNSSHIYLLPFREPGKVLLAVSMDAAHRARRKEGGSVWAEFRPEDILLLEPPGEEQG